MSQDTRELCPVLRHLRPLQPKKRRSQYQRPLRNAIQTCPGARSCVACWQMSAARALECLSAWT